MGSAFQKRFQPLPQAPERPCGPRIHCSEAPHCYHTGYRTAICYHCTLPVGPFYLLWNYSRFLWVEPAAGLGKWKCKVYDIREIWTLFGLAWHPGPPKLAGCIKHKPGDVGGGIAGERHPHAHCGRTGRSQSTSQRTQVRVVITRKIPQLNERGCFACRGRYESSQTHCGPRERFSCCALVALALGFLPQTRCSICVVHIPFGV